MHEKLGASNPLTDPTVEEIPDEKREVAENLQKTNQDMIDKMHTLIELTQKVIGKMKQHAHAERLGSSGGSPGHLVHESVEELGLVNQLHELTEQVMQETRAAERVKVERNDLERKLKVLEKDHQRYVDLGNMIKDSDREVELLLR